MGIISMFPIGGRDSSSVANSKEVNFLDYDRTILYSYTAAEFAALSSMPANPTRDGLTAQGWNWSFANAKAYVAKYGNLNIGQMYVTDDGKTRIYIHLEEGRTSPVLGVCPNGTVDIDWGDGTTHDTLTGSSTSTAVYTSAHSYAAPGDYVIQLTVTGSMGFSRECLLVYSYILDNRNYVYKNAIQKVELGSGFTSIGDYAFYKCSSLSSITIPDSVTSIGNQAFGECYCLSSITIPDGVTSIGNQAFGLCVTLSSIIIPNSVTSIGDYAFYSCYSLLSVTIPNSVTSIGERAFYNCCGLAHIYFLPTTPPSVSNSNAFSNLSVDCVIHVPVGSLSAYTSATNYPSSSTYTYVEDIV